MSFEIQEISSVSRDLILNLAEEVIGSELKRLASKMSHEVKMPGFRSGKVPFSVIMQRYGKGLRQDAVHRVAAEEANNILQNLEDIVFAGGVEVLNFQLEGGGALARVGFEVRPRFSLKDLNGISLERIKVEPNEEGVNLSLEDMRKRYAATERVESGIVEKDDLVKLEKDGVVGDSAVEVGDKVYDESVWSSVIGSEVGSVHVIKSEDGVEHTFKVLELTKRVLPALDDDFAKDTGEAESLEELKSKIRKELESQLKSFSDYSINKMLSEKLCALHSEVELPMAFIRSRALEQLKSQIERYTGKSFDHKLLEAMSDQLEEQYVHRVALEYFEGLVLDEVASREGFEVSEEDIDEKAKQMFSDVRSYQLKRWLESGGRDVVKSELLRDKARDFIIEHAEITEVPYMKTQNNGEELEVIEAEEEK